jgi:hypothetical protein
VFPAPGRSSVYRALVRGGRIHAVLVTMRGADRDTVVAFELALAEVLHVLHVLQAQRLFRDPDYLRPVIARELSNFQQMYDERLATLPGRTALQFHPRYLIDMCVR